MPTTPVTFQDDPVPPPEEADDVDYDPNAEANEAHAADLRQVLSAHKAKHGVLSKKKPSGKKPLDVSLHNTSVTIDGHRYQLTLINVLRYRVNLSQKVDSAGSLMDGAGSKWQFGRKQCYHPQAD